MASIYKCFSAVAFPCSPFQVNPIKTLPIFLSETVNEDEMNEIIYHKKYDNSL